MRAVGPGVERIVDPAHCAGTYIVARKAQTTSGVVPYQEFGGAQVLVLVMNVVAGGAFYIVFHQRDRTILGGVRCH